MDAWEGSAFWGGGCWSAFPHQPLGPRVEMPGSEDSAAGSSHRRTQGCPPPALVSSGLSRYGLWPGPVEGGAAGSTLVFRDFAARDWGSYLISTTPTQLRVFGDSSRMLIWTRFPLYKFLLLAQSLNSSVNVKAPGTRGPLPWAVHFRRPLERGDW